jgi:hypothetical protein
VTADTTETTGVASPVVTQAYNSAPGAPSTTYGIHLIASNELPIIAVSTTAPTPSGAQRVAQATITGLRRALGRLEVSQRIRTPARLVLQSLGPATGGTTTAGPKLTKAIGYGIVAFVVLLLAIMLLLDNLLTGRRARRAPNRA